MYKLVCFDIDGTLISDSEGPYWRTLMTQLAGETPERNKQLVQEFMAGKLTYNDWCEHDLQQLKHIGATEKQFQELATHHHVLPGAHEVLERLTNQGYILGIISGSLNILFDTLFPEHPFTEIHCTKVFFTDGKLSRWKATEYEQGRKHEALRKMCTREGIPLSQAAFVGDNENDIDVLQAAGLGIAFRPKTSKVAYAADIIIDDLREIPSILENHKKP